MMSIQGESPYVPQSNFVPPLLADRRKYEQKPDPILLKEHESLKKRYKMEAQSQEIMSVEPVDINEVRSYFPLT